MDPLKKNDIYDLSIPDAYGISKFNIYEGENLQTQFLYKANNELKKLINMIEKLKGLDDNFNSWFIKKLEYIKITSMYRPKKNPIFYKTSRHSGPHNAVDFFCYPLYLNLYLYIQIKKYFKNQTIFISSFAPHIHIDNRKYPLRGFEILNMGGKIIFPSSAEHSIKFNPKHHKVSIIDRPKNQEQLKDYLLKYYCLADAPFMSTIKEFINENIIDKTEKTGDTNPALFFIVLLFIFINSKKGDRNE